MYLNLIQLAESFGVSEGVVEGWIRDEGLPHTPDRGRLLFDRSQVAEWAAKLAPAGGGLALPHPSTRITLGRDSGTVALLFMRDALPPEEVSPDGLPITRLCFFIAPSPRGHLELLGRLSRSLACGPLREL